jgi:hypothetical protein
MLPAYRVLVVNYLLVICSQNRRARKEFVFLLKNLTSLRLCVRPFPNQFQNDIIVGFAR